MHANLSGANLREAILSEADLSNARLSMPVPRIELERFWEERVGKPLSQRLLCFSRQTMAEDDLPSNYPVVEIADRRYTSAFLDRADLFAAVLSGACLYGVSLRGAKLSAADLGNADVRHADLSEANLFGAHLASADLTKAHLCFADLRRANLTASNLIQADLTGAKLAEATLEKAILVETNLLNADLTGSRVYGIAAWELKLDGAIQKDLIITRGFETPLTTDSIEVAQFMSLLINNKNLRHVIDTITSKVVLILGRFAPERKIVLDALRNELRKRDYLPVLCDFEKPESKDLTGTVETIARMARFIIADLTDPRSVPHELATLPRLDLPRAVLAIGATEKPELSTENRTEAGDRA